MAGKKQIKTALISVFHKDGLEDLLKKLDAEGVKFLSTGGTQEFIESLGYPCQKVEDVTSYPSILGGRVKTLHPKVFGGILSRRDNEGDQAQMQKYEIPFIDLVIVDLYPFEQTVASGASAEDIIEKIDIGGISLIRAGAKNFKDVVMCQVRQNIQCCSRFSIQMVRRQISKTERCLQSVLLVLAATMIRLSIAGLQQNKHRLEKNIQL